MIVIYAAGYRYTFALARRRLVFDEQLDIIVVDVVCGDTVSMPSRLAYIATASRMHVGSDWVELTMTPSWYRPLSQGLAVFHTFDCVAVAEPEVTNGRMVRCGGPSEPLRTYGIHYRCLQGLLRGVHV